MSKTLATIRSKPKEKKKKENPSCVIVETDIQDKRGHRMLELKDCDGQLLPKCGGDVCGHLSDASVFQVNYLNRSSK